MYIQSQEYKTKPQPMKYNPNKHHRRSIKTVSTKQINILRDAPGTPVWQRNYYEHIIRNQDALAKIREYMINNPIVWEIDQLHPNHPAKW